MYLSVTNRPDCLHGTRVLTSRRGVYSWGRDESEVPESVFRLRAVVRQCTFRCFGGVALMRGPMGVGCISWILPKCSLLLLAFSGLPTLALSVFPDKTNFSVMSLYSHVRGLALALHSFWPTAPATNDPKTSHYSLKPIPEENQGSSTDSLSATNNLRDWLTQSPGGLSLAKCPHKTQSHEDVCLHMYLDGFPPIHTEMELHWKQVKEEIGKIKYSSSENMKIASFRSPLPL